jgi:UTP-glucose-1-phosphate uridylyltransferase
VDIILYFLAKWPSSQSVIPQKMKSSMLKVALPGKSTYINSTIKNNKGIRDSVTQLAKFIGEAMETKKKIVATQNLNFFIIFMVEEIAFVVMAAGIGSRYKGTKQLETFGKSKLTIAEYNMQHAIDAGFRRFYFVIDDKFAEIFHRRLKDFLPPNCKFELIYQKKEESLAKFCNRQKPWGTGHAIMCCGRAVRCNFCVTNADDLYGHDAISRMAEFLRSVEKKSRTFANVAYALSETLSGNGAVSRGVISIDGDSYLTSIEEVHGLAMGTYGGAISKDSLVSMNLWGFTPEIFKLLEEGWRGFKQNVSDIANDEFGISNFIDSAVRGGRCRVKILHTSSRWHGITYQTDRALVEKILSE